MKTIKLIQMHKEGQEQDEKEFNIRELSRNQDNIIKWINEHEKRDNKVEEITEKEAIKKMMEKLKRLDRS